MGSLKCFWKGILLCSIVIGNGILLYGQDCVGGEIRTNEAYLYGRFEVAMRSAAGDGVVSSFFLYNADVGCNWPAENNEIDVEMTGNSEQVFFTTHYPGPWYYSDTYSPTFNPHEGVHDYVIEWEPGIVRWFVDGVLVNVQDQDFVADLIHPMRIMMNLWAAEASTWVGVWDPAIMPVTSVYDYVRYAAYTPGMGNTGTDNNFTLMWTDDFTTINEDLWTISESNGFGGNYCTFSSSSVLVDGGYLYLQLETPQTSTETVPVTFSVDMSEENLLPTDVMHLAGTFNGWCGDCLPMTLADGVWSYTLALAPGLHEFIFVKNFWEASGNPPLASSCDILPCDEWANYGVVVPANAAPNCASYSLLAIVYCLPRSGCSTCASTYKNINSRFRYIWAYCCA